MPDEKKSTLDEKMSGYSPDMLHHQAIMALSRDNSDAMSILSPEEVEAFSVVEAICTVIKLPITEKFIERQKSLSRATGGIGREQFTSCLRTHPNVISPGMTTLTQGEETKKSGSWWPFGRKKQQQSQEAKA